MTSPTFCYVILAHTDPEGLIRLVRRIRALSPDAGIVVRHQDPALIGPAELDPLGAIDLVSDVAVTWGGWGMVQAAVEALGTALTRTQADFVTLISGQDYPIRDLATWESEVVAAGVDAILDPMEAKPHTYQRHFLTFELPGSRTVAKRAVHWVMDRIGWATDPHVKLYRMERTGPDRWWFSVPRRGGERPPEWFVKASQWMTVRRDVLEQALAVAGPHAGGLHRARTILIPDEVALQSEIAGLAQRVLHGPTSALRFPEDASSPDWLSPELVAELSSATAAPFARKMPVEGWRDVAAAADAASERERAASKAAAGDRAGADGDPDHADPTAPVGRGLGHGPVTSGMALRPAGARPGRRHAADRHAPHAAAPGGTGGSPRV